MTQHKHTNRLAAETSPYLLQHANNPVDWYPWGREAFQRARDENKPIFLSVGYSTCYWCHVMERESFENEATAELMNREFINIKVDREERPDVDQLYMTAVQIMTQSGGWPMSVFLTPDLKPFYGGTYFPPRDMFGRPGFPTLLKHIADAWRTRRQEVDQAADGLTDALRQYSLPMGGETPLRVDGEFIDGIVGRSIAGYDRNWGGFGGAPKFPRQTLLELLLAYCEQVPHDSPAKVTIRHMLAHTLEMMAQGGIRDQLGGAFHRYSTDAQWLVPHFEIMLYDNAMLLTIYAWAAGALNRREFAAVARGIADFVIGEMAGPEGQFYTAFDAEVDGREGASYFWTQQQVDELLSGEEAELFKTAYGINLGPNFADPHHGSGEEDANVLFMPQSSAELARNLGIDAEDLEAKLSAAREKLLHARKQRKQPLLDTKVLTSWNALMIRALALAGRLLEEKRYTEAAIRAMVYLLKHHRTADHGLYRTSRDGVKQVRGFLDDYATTAQALLELHRTTEDQRWLTEAHEVARQMLRRFSSPFGALYFTDAGADEVLVRQIVATDSPLPSGNAVAALVLMELGNVEAAEGIIRAFADQLNRQGEAFSSLVQAAMLCVARRGALEVPAGKPAGQMGALAHSPAEVVRARAKRVDQNRARIVLEIAPGFHVYTHQAPPGLYPTRVTVSGVDARVQYPPKSKDLPLPDGALAGVWEGQVAIEIEAAEPLAGKTALVQAQPCSHGACLAQATLTIQLL